MIESRNRVLLLASLLMVLAFGPALAESEDRPTMEPEGVPAGKPYQVVGTLEWIDVTDRELLVSGSRYRYQVLRVHRTGEAASNESQETFSGLQPGMTVGLATGGGNFRPMLDVWVLE